MKVLHHLAASAADVIYNTAIKVPRYLLDKAQKTLYIVKTLRGGVGEPLFQLVLVVVMIS